jgi:hypothetical protein
MSPNAFVGKKLQPFDADLADALGPAKAAWDQFLAELADALGANGYEWKCYSVKTGWALRVKRKARTIVWLTPSRGSFEVLFILSDKALQAARQAILPKRVVKALDEAPKYPEGSGVRLAVKSSRDVTALMKLAAIKHAH